MTASCFVLSEDAAGIFVGDAASAQKIAAHLRKQVGYEDVVPGLDTVTVRFDPCRTRVSEVHARLLNAAQDAPELPTSTTKPIELCVRYGGVDGPDLERVCETLGIRQEEFIARHVSALHTVDMMGFTPGFAYVSGGDAALSVARLPVPRPRLPAGSVGVSGVYTGLYSLQGPGGWPIIGRTDARLFDASAPEHFLLQPGQKLRFTAA